MNATWSPFRNLKAAAWVAGAVAVLAFANSLWNGFAFDDVHILLENEAIQSLETLPQALVDPYWPGRYGPGLGLWRPLTTGVFGLEWALWGDHPLGYHVVNVLLHGGVTALVVLLLGGILPVAGAFLGGLIFAVHPVHVEAVANVVGMSELMGAFFFLLACLLVLRDREWEMSAGRLSLVLAFFALAFLSKESAVTLPGVVLLLDSARNNLGFGDLRDYLRKRWPLYGGLVVTAGLVLFARFRVLGNVAEPFAPLGAHLLDEIPRIWTVASTWPHIVRLLFFPQDLVVDYGPAVIPVSLGWNVVNILGAVTVLTVLAFSFVSWRRGPMGPDRLSSRAPGWGVVWFAITLAPTSNIFFLTGILLSERTLYLPSVGFVAAAAWLLLKLHGERPAVARGMAVLALSLMAFRSWTRTPTWKDNMEVFSAFTQEHPESGRAQWIMGDSNFQAGRVSEALRFYRAALGIIGGHYTVVAEIGRTLMLGGHERAAERMLIFAWEDQPDFAFAPGLLATLYDRQGRFPEAETAARASLSGDPESPIQLHILSRALQAQGRMEEAREARWGAIQEGEGGHWQQWVWLAELDAALGDTAAALAALDSARARAPTPSERQEVEDFLARIGLVPPGNSFPESARDSQNPTLQAP